MDDVFHHCERLVRLSDKDRFLATLFAPAAARGALFALYAFDIEIDAVRERAREPMPGEIRLQWWREVLSGERASEGAAHPVAAALLETIARYGLPAQRLNDLLEAHAFDLYDDPMPSLEALQGYVRQTSGTIFDLAARICGGPAEEGAELAGLAYGITSLLRSFARHASRRQLFVPVALLKGETSAQTIFAGESSAPLEGALRILRSRALEHYEAFERTLPHLPTAAFPALLPVALVPGYLAVMERADYAPFQSAVEVPQWRRQWTLWRAARRYVKFMKG
jgi:phytoene synthase